MSEDLELGLFPQEIIDAYNKELDAADEADEIAVKVVASLDCDYDWESHERVRSPGVPTLTSNKKTRPIRSIVIRNLSK